MAMIALKVMVMVALVDAIVVVLVKEAGVGDDGYVDGISNGSDGCGCVCCVGGVDGGGCVVDSSG